MNSVVRLPKRTLQIVGADGRPMLVFDLEERRIDVPEGVKVSEAAEEVLRVLRRYLWGA